MVRSPLILFLDINVAVITQQKQQSLLALPLGCPC